MSRSQLTPTIGVMKRLIAILTTVGLTMLLAAPPALARSKGQGRRTLVVDIHFTDPGVLTGIQTVRCGIEQPGGCEAEFRGHSTVTGTMTGWTDYTMWAHGNPDGSKSWYTHETFTGTVDGCGRGTFEFMAEDGVVESSPSETDPTGQDFHAAWSVIPDAGTGDLARLVGGGGEQNGITYPDTSSHGTMIGTIECDQ